MTSPRDSLADSLQRALGDGYRVDRELGGGGMSRVFVARDLTLDRDIVIKVLPGEATTGISADRFRREIQLIAKLQHAHVVPILSAGAADDSLYYTMPFVSGESLRARIVRDGPLPIADVVRLLREILDALAFAHDHGVVHRDIKPENVLVGAGHVVVADFGIAKALRESGTMTVAGLALGTPQYMAPEQATADPATDHRADLYAVGVMGYELLTGTPPFSGSAQQLITAHLTTPPPSITTKRADTPKALADVVMRALAKEPDARPQSAREMIAALESVTTPSGVARDASSSRSRVWWPAFAAAAVLAIAGFFLRSRLASSSTASSAVADGADLIAVMPLSAVSDTSLTRLGQDLVVTLSSNLDGVGSLHTVDAVTLLMRARQAPSPMPLTDARALAKQLGARSVLTGTLINEGDRVRASVTLSRVGSDSAIARASALAAAHDIAAITDSLTWGVLQAVWRRGTAPSPVLTGRMTKSFDALRAFLDGERYFFRLDAPHALPSYRRAFELDSNFAQAFLRYDYANDWVLNSTGVEVHRRLMALKDSLPERERLWLETREAPMTVPERIAAFKELAKRYPDYPPVLMGVADPILHSGPIYGIPLMDARPWLDRITQLVPDHPDTKFHLGFMLMATGDADDAATTLLSAGNGLDNDFGSEVKFMGDLVASTKPGGKAPTPAQIAAAATLFSNAGDGARAFADFSGKLGLFPINPSVQLEALDYARKSDIYKGGIDLASALGEGELRVYRGDWIGGLRALERAESSALSFGSRASSARVAVMGAWLGAVDTATAERILRRVQAFPRDNAARLDRAELLWLDGLQAVNLGDEARVRRAQQELSSDTSVAFRYAKRSLTGLWLDHIKSKAGADTLKAISDDAMRSRVALLSVEAIDRLVVARALRQRGTPAEAERYLMWPDAGINTGRAANVQNSVGPLVRYERGLALEEAGKRPDALYQLRKFVSAYDQPQPAHRALVDDAKQRIAKLEITDAAPKSKVTSPR
jgi:serine/threonine protein kinase/tetratricopeptide (TPR) repeat protein